MTHTINSYFAILMVTIFGAGAVMTILRVVDSNTLATTLYGSEAHYVVRSH